MEVNEEIEKMALVLESWQSDQKKLIEDQEDVITRAKDLERRFVVIREIGIRLYINLKKSDISKENLKRYEKSMNAIERSYKNLMKRYLRGSNG